MTGLTWGYSVENRQTCSQMCSIWSANIRNKGQHTYLCNIKCKFKDVNILHKKDAHSMKAAAFLSVHHEYSNSYLTHFHSVCVCVLYRFWMVVSDIFLGKCYEGTGKNTRAHTHTGMRALSHHTNILMGHICNVGSHWTREKCKKHTKKKKKKTA